MDYTGIDDDISQEYKVYPNPAHHFVTIDMANEQTNATIRVLDIKGKILQIVEQDRCTKIDLDISSYKAGTYLIHLQSDQINGVSRLVKE